MPTTEEEQIKAALQAMMKAVEGHPQGAVMSAMAFALVDALMRTVKTRGEAKHRVTVLAGRMRTHIEQHWRQPGDAAPEAEKPAAQQESGT